MTTNNIYETLDDSGNGPYKDVYDLHVHRYYNFDNTIICKICNNLLISNKLSTTKITSIYDIDNKNLMENLKLLNFTKPS